MAMIFLLKGKSLFDLRMLRMNGGQLARWPHKELQVRYFEKRMIQIDMRLFHLWSRVENIRCIYDLFFGGFYNI